MDPPRLGSEDPMNDDALVRVERQVLAAVCREAYEGSVRDSARELLAGYEWRDAAHQAVFDIVMKFPDAASEVLREQLPAKLTLRGFPDFDFDSLFELSIPPDAETEQWMRKLWGVSHTC
ncbi:MAG TPA: hypothetical protein VL523_06440 [Terriglobia bacterium]|nr:hypothetical protein [Terriglobia bacterium]